VIDAVKVLFYYTLLALMYKKSSKPCLTLAMIIRLPSRNLTSIFNRKEMFHLSAMFFGKLPNSPTNQWMYLSLDYVL
jgi:hypothetical protein